MRLHLAVRVGNCVRNVDLVACIHESVVEAHGEKASLFLRVQIINFFLVCRGLVGYIIAAVLVPATLALLKASIGLGGPYRRFHPG